MLKNPNRLCIITDLDGTLLPKSKVPLTQDLEAIRRFEAAGGIFTIATGRTVQASHHYPEMLGLKSPMIVFNGAAIYDPAEGRLLFTHPLPDTAKTMTKELLADHAYAGVEVLCAEDTWVVNNTVYEQEHVRVCGVTPQYAAVDEIDGTWLKVLFAMDPADVPAFMDDVAERHYQGVDFIRSDRKFYEMMPAGVSKGSALHAYRQLPGMEDFSFIAVGDYDNDIEMLKAADLAVCPANATDTVKAVADLVLEHTCEEGAMSELIGRILEGTL